MLLKPDFYTARNLLMEHTAPVEKERIPLETCVGRILAETLLAGQDVPPFDRSAYDGYALRAEDVASAGEQTPVVLQVVEEIPAGSAPTKAIAAGMAAKILTGAPIPQGADAVVAYERTKFTEDTVAIFAPLRKGDSIVTAGEDVKAGTMLAPAGERIGVGLAGTLAAQGTAAPLVYKRPAVGVISTGSELVEVGESVSLGKIHNSNRYTISAALEKIGCEARFLGMVGDGAEEICRLIQTGLAECDAVILTGGVSVGDYDLTPAAMEMAGVELLLRGVQLKPGMACCCGVKDGKMVYGLSGNPASSLTAYYAIVQPALKKLAGYRETVPQEFFVELAQEYKKKSPAGRLLCGKLDISDGTAKMQLQSHQGNAVISSFIGCDMMAVVPKGSGPLPAGARLKAFLL